MSATDLSLAETNPMRSFEAKRRRQLIEATIETVSEVGFKSASLGEIARRAGVSQGLFAHYFGDKEGLLEATLRFMATRLARATAARMRAARTPLERVLAVPESALAPEEFDPRTSAVWLAFWGQIMHSEPYRRVQTIYQQRMRSNLRHGLRSLVAPERLEISVSFIAATIDGLWLQSHTTRSRRSDGAEARGVVRELVTLLISREGARQPPSAPALESPMSGAPTRSWTTLDGAGCQAWRNAGREERAEVLRLTAARLREERRSIARLEARDSSRPVADIERHDLPLVIRLFERASEAASAPAVDRVGLTASEFGYLDREPVALVLTRAHWSAPLLLASRVAVPALAAGASIVASSSARKARALSRLAKFLCEAGMPEDALEVLCGGETERARRDSAGAVKGSWDAPPKSAVVVADDADLASAAASLVRGPRRWAQARAFSETLIFAAAPIRRELVDRLRSEAGSLELGDATAPETEIGPLADRDHLERALALVAEACKAGATLRLGGRVHEGGGRSRAAFLKATVLDRCREDMAIARTPLFAPVFAICDFDNDAEAAERIRRLGPDLSLGVYGRDTERARRLARNAGALICRVNDAEASFVSAREDWADPWTDRFETVRRTIVSMTFPRESSPF